MGDIRRDLRLWLSREDSTYVSGLKVYHAGTDCFKCSIETNVIGQIGPLLAAT